MRIMIVGYGEHGSQLAEILSQEGHDLTIVEKDREKLELAQEKLDALTFRDDIDRERVLLDAEIDKMDVVVGFTDRDSVNILCCMIAKEHGVPRTVARINDASNYEVVKRTVNQNLGIDFVVNPDLLIVDEICTMIDYLDAAEAVEFIKGKIVFLAYHIRSESSLLEKKISYLLDRAKESRMILLGITRDEKMIAPAMDEVIGKDDIISFVCKHEDKGAISKVFGFSEEPAHNIYVSGGGRIGLKVASRLAEQHNVKVWDISRERCEYVAEKLPDCLVLCSDTSDIEALQEEGIDEADIFLALTKDDQKNILGALLAEKCGAKRAMATVRQFDLMKLASSLGVTACINPRYVTSNKVLEFVMGETVYNIARLQETDADVIDFKITPDSAIVGEMIKDLDIPHGIKVGAIIRNGDVVVPLGEDRLSAGDHVIVLSTLEDIQKAEEFFSNNHGNHNHS